jgi:hypothetical protein
LTDILKFGGWQPVGYKYHLQIQICRWVELYTPW